MRFEELKNGFCYGMHGCGFYKGVYHVNAYEPFKYWQKKGVQVMEIDIAKTSDGLFVALAHLMNERFLSWVEVTHFPLQDGEGCTEKWFMNQKLCAKTTKGLSPMNLTMIVDEMVNATDLFIMFDLWGMWERNDTRCFAQQLQILFEKSGVVNMAERCVIEVYNKSQLRGIRDVSDHLNIMYLVHGSMAPEFDENVSPAILKSLGVNAISFPWIYTKEHPGELEQYHQEGFVVFSLYKDNRYSRQMRKCGVNVNLVDTLYIPNSFAVVVLQKLKFRFRIFLKKFRKL